MALNMNSVGILGGFRGSTGFSVKIWDLGRFWATWGVERLSRKQTKSAFEHWYTVGCGNRLCVGVRAKNASVSGSPLTTKDATAELHCQHERNERETPRCSKHILADTSSNTSSLPLFTVFTLPALQKSFVNTFFVFAWEFCIEKWRGFLVNFFCSPSPMKRSRKNPGKIRERFGAKFGAKFGTNIQKNRGTFVLQLF